MATKRSMAEDHDSVKKRARETTCPICLHPIEDLTLMESCSHQFCYDCIREIVRVIIEEEEFRRLNEHTWPLTTEDELVDQAIQRLVEMLTARFNPLSDGADFAIFSSAPKLIKLLTGFRSRMDQLPRNEVISSLLFRFVVYFMDADRHTLVTPHTEVKLNASYIKENRSKLRSECLPFVIREMRAITSLDVFNTSLLMDLLLDSLADNSARREQLFALLKQLGVDHPRTFLKSVRTFASSDQSLLLYDSNSRFKCRTSLSSAFTDDSDIQIISAPQNGDVEFVGESMPNSRNVLRDLQYNMPSSSFYADQSDHDIEVIHETRSQPYFQQLDISDDDDDIVIDLRPRHHAPRRHNQQQSSNHDEIVL